MRERLIRRARTVGLDLAPSLASGLEAYHLELARWNTKVNLTAFALDGGGTDAAIDRLLIEPVLAARYIPPDATALLDAGSGGGSPAIPLKLARPDLALYMVEVKVRKSVFLRQVARTLDLRETDVLTARFEELLTRSDLHEAMSAVSIRAVRVDQKVMTTLQAFLKTARLPAQLHELAGRACSSGSATGKRRRLRSPAGQSKPIGAAPERSRRQPFHVKRSANRVDAMGSQR